jgi:hypothetical protein
MRSAVGRLVLVGAVVALVGCGGSETFSDDKVADAAKVEDGFVGGDPFCEVGNVLNDADEIDQAGEKKGGVIITSNEGNVGVVVVPPFPDDCASKVRQGLNKLDPKQKDE